MKYYADNALKTQKKAMHNGKLRYDGHGHCKVIKRLFDQRMFGTVFPSSHQLFDLGDGRTSCAKPLKPEACLQAAPSSQRERILLTWSWRSATFSIQNTTLNENRNNATAMTIVISMIEVMEAVQQRRQRWPTVSQARRHGKWKDCRLKRHGNNHIPRREVDSMEEQHQVHFQDPSRFEHLSAASSDDKMPSDSEYISNSEVFHTMDDSSKMPHPVTLMTLKDTPKEWLIARVLIDQCCAETGFITHDLAMALGPPLTKETDTTPFKTASNLLDKHSNQTRMLQTSFPFKHLHIQSSFHSNAKIGQFSDNDVILCQASKAHHDLDTTYCTKIISWGNKELPLVSRSYWRPECFRQQKECFILAPEYTKLI